VIEKAQVGARRRCRLGLLRVARKRRSGAREREEQVGGEDDRSEGTKKAAESAARASSSVTGAGVGDRAGVVFDQSISR
jgi:hypothetical protein